MWTRSYSTSDGPQALAPRAVCAADGTDDISGRRGVRSEAGASLAGELCPAETESSEGALQGGYWVLEKSS